MKILFQLRCALVCVLLVSCATQQGLLQINLVNHQNLVLHIHPMLEIYILGKRQVIPANIGITDQTLRVIHTHDADGILHVESPVPHQFVLGDFFTIWGKTFSSQCIFEHCVDGDHLLEVLVNGDKSGLHENLPLTDAEHIQIIYRKKGIEHDRS